MLPLSINKIVIFGFILFVAFDSEGIRFSAKIIFALFVIQISLNRIVRMWLLISTDGFCFNLRKKGFLTIEDGVMVHT